MYWLKDINLSFKYCRASLKDILSRIQSFLCKSSLDMTGRIATGYRKKTVGKNHFSVILYSVF